MSAAVTKQPFPFGVRGSDYTLDRRRDGRESAKDALEVLREHTRSCPDHPLGALWAAHRHLRDPVPAVRIAALVLASEAPWWLGRFEDARLAAQAAADTDPT